MPSDWHFRIVIWCPERMRRWEEEHISFDAEGRGIIKRHV